MKERVERYLADSCIQKTIFCRKIGISTSHLYAWLKGERNISGELHNKINDYLNKYSVQ